MPMKASRRTTATHPIFDAVINEAVNEYGLTEEDIVKNGYRIYTELWIKITKQAHAGDL